MIHLSRELKVTEADTFQKILPESFKLNKGYEIECGEVPENFSAIASKILDKCKEMNVKIHGILDANGDKFIFLGSFARKMNTKTRTFSSV